MNDLNNFWQDTKRNIFHLQNSQNFLFFLQSVGVEDGSNFAIYHVRDFSYEGSQKRRKCFSSYSIWHLKSLLLTNTLTQYVYTLLFFPLYKSAMERQTSYSSKYDMYKQFERPTWVSKQDALELATILHNVKMIV